MADPVDEGTQIEGGAVATAPEPSAGAKPTGSTNPQPDNPEESGSDAGDGDAKAKVDPKDTGDGDKSGSDEGDGDQSGKDDRSRPSRAKRAEERISQLDKQAKDYQKKAESLEDENSKLKEMLKDPLKEADIKLPDYSQQDNVTPAQLKQDIVNAADQIVKLRLDQYIPENNREMTVRQYRERAYEDIRSVIKAHPELDEKNDEAFDSDLDTFLSNTFQRVFKADPSYRFTELADEVFKQRGGRDQSNIKPSDEGSGGTSKGSKAALRQTGNKGKTYKPVADMTAAEYREYFAETHRS